MRLYALHMRSSDTKSTDARSADTRNHEGGASKAREPARRLLLGPNREAHLERRKRTMRLQGRMYALSVERRMIFGCGE